MKTILPLIALSLMVATPAFAQEEGTPVPAQESLPADAPALAAPAESITPRQLELAKQMHEIWPIRTRVESAIDAVVQNFPPDKQAQAKASLRKSIQFDQVEEESIQAMASTFTEDELKAMVDFYGSEIGRSVSAKTAEYETAMRPIIIKMMDKAALDLKTGMTP